MAYPLTGSLISGPQCDVWLRDCLRRGASDVRLCSAFFRSEVMARLVLERESGSVNGRILVRWRLSDIIAGASDLALFNVCRSAAVDLYMRLDFHGKVYAMPEHGIVVGSANATGRGLGYGGLPNAELCTLVDCSPFNWAIVNDLFVSATKVDEALFARLSEAVAAVNSADLTGVEWPEDIMNDLKIDSTPQKLLVDECLHTEASWWPEGEAAPMSEPEQHDIHLLNVVPGASLADLQRGVRQLRLVRWLRVQLEQSAQRELYFGNLTALLHDSLLDDPGPRRREVKALVQNLLSWCQIAQLSEFRIDRPNYSQRITLMESSG